MGGDVNLLKFSANNNKTTRTMTTKTLIILLATQFAFAASETKDNVLDTLKSMPESEKVAQELNDDFPVALLVPELNLEYEDAEGQETREGKQYRYPPRMPPRYLPGMQQHPNRRMRYKNPIQNRPPRRRIKGPRLDLEEYFEPSPAENRRISNRRLGDGDYDRIMLSRPGRDRSSISSSGSDYYEWESRKVGQELIPFRPDVKLDEKDIPRPSVRTPQPSNVSRNRFEVREEERPWRPANPSTPPRILVTPAITTMRTEEFLRPRLAASTPQPGNNRLHTEYFSIPAPISNSEKQRTPSKIPVLVKKLAKRPVNRNKSAAVIPSVVITTPKPQNETDICANSDIDCGVSRNGNVERRPERKKLLDFLRGEIWVIPVIVFALALAVFLLIFEVFLISKAVASTPSRRHLFLGQTLMLGLLMCCATTVLLSLKPTPSLCAASRVGVGLSYCLVYATLLVKLVFLISLNSGVYLPATYQGLLLCFAILIQIVIGVQWLFSSPAAVLHLTIDSTGEVFSSCDVTFRQHILGLLYVIFLLAVVVVLAFKSRGVRENYREAMYIGLTLFFTLCIFALWMVGGFLSTPAYGDACLAGGLVASAAITFVIMFMPKGRQLSAMGRDGLYSEDRAEMYAGAAAEGSSTQSTGSTGGTPSPSFFPVKPGKLPQQTSSHHHHHHHRERMDTPPPSRKQVSPSSASSSFPPPPPPPPEFHHHHQHQHQRPSSSSHHLHHHQPASHHNHHHSVDMDHHHHNHRHDSMDNLVGTQHHHNSRNYNTHHSVFRGGAGEQFGRWRSRSSPPVARRLKSWATSQTDLNNFESGGAYDDDAIGRPRTNFHSSFHDLHLANEERASRHDLSQMREEVMRGFRGGGAERSSRGDLRKWPLPPAGGFNHNKGSPSCRRCSEEGRFF